MLSRILSTVMPFFTRGWVQILVYGLVFCSGALLLAFNGGVTNDSWWHLKTGEELWQGNFSFQDTHNWTAPEVFWPAHELGFEWILYGLWKLAGDSFLIAAVVNVLLVLGTVVLLIPSKSLRGKFSLKSNVLVPLLIFGAVYIMLGSVQIRAQAFSYLLFALTVRLILSRKPYLLPPLFLLWVWLHGSVLIGVALFGVATLLMIGRWLLEKGSPEKARDALHFSIAGILSLIVLNFSPLGLKLWPYFLETFSYGQTRISEWQPLSSSPLVIGYSVALVGLLLLAGWRLWSKKKSWELIYLYTMSVFFLIYSFGALRVFSNFLMIALPILFIAAMSLFTGERARPAREPAQEKLLKIISFCIVGVLTVVSLLFMVPITQKVMENTGRDPFLKDGVAEVLRGDQCKDSTWNDYDTGSYLIWFMPDIKVSIDSRFDLYPRWVTDAAGVTIPPGGSTDPTELLNKVFRDYDINCMVMSNTTDSQALEARGLKVIGENIDTIVFEIPDTGIPAKR